MKGEITPIKQNTFLYCLRASLKQESQTIFFILWQISEENTFKSSSLVPLSLSQNPAFLTKQTYYFCMLQLLVD